MAKSPVVIPFTTDGVEIGVEDASALPTSARGFISVGVDSLGDTYFLRINSSGQLLIDVVDRAARILGHVVVDSSALPTGAATEATLAFVNGKLNSLGQKTMAGSVPVVLASDQGSITVTNSSAGTNGAAAPASSTQIGGSDGTNLQALRVFDLDTGVGTEYDLGVSIRLPGAGGSVVGGTLSDPIRIDPTGTTTQPVSGTVTSNQGSAALIAGAWPIKITDGTNTATVKAASTAPVAADLALVVSISPNSTLTAVNPSVGANAAAIPASSTQIGGSDGTNLQAARVFDVDTGGGIQYALGTNIRISGSGGSVEAKGQQTMANSIPVVLPSDQSISVTVVPTGSTTGLVQGLKILGGGTTGTLNLIFATAYTEQSSNAQRSLTSSSASDTSAGTGAIQVTITYYDSTMAGPFTETVTMSGTTAVATVSSTICYIEKMQVTSVGSGGTNAGTITLFVNNSGGGGTIGTIGVGNIIASVGDRQTLWSHHYVPSTKTASLATLVVGSTNSPGTNCTYFLRAKNPLISTSPDLQISDFIPAANSIVRALGIPIKITGPARITAYGVPSGNNMTIAASFDYSEV